MLFRSRLLEHAPIYEQPIINVQMVAKRCNSSTVIPSDYLKKLYFFEKVATGFRGSDPISFFNKATQSKIGQWNVGPICHVTTASLIMS